MSARLSNAYRPGGVGRTQVGIEGIVFAAFEVDFQLQGFGDQVVDQVFVVGLLQVEQGGFVLAAAVVDPGQVEVVGGLAVFFF